MKVFVGGSEGSLMQAVIPVLLEQGHQVVGVDSFFRYGRIQRHRDYHFIEADLTDRQAVRSAVRGCDGVIQAGARIFGVLGFHKYPADILAQDLLIQQNVLLESLEAGVEKLAYISSSMVYERCETHPSREEDADESLIPSTEYGLSKLVGERLTRAFASQYGLNYVIWRPFNIITPYEKGDDEIGMSHVFADYTRRIISEGLNPLPIIGDGEQVRCFTWLYDVAEAIGRHTFDPRSDREVFNLGNPRPVTMRELAQMIFDAARRRNVVSDNQLSFEHLDAPADDVRIRIPDVSKAMQLLDWSAKVSLEEAVERCVAQTAAALPVAV